MLIEYKNHKIFRDQCQHQRAKSLIRLAQRAPLQHAPVEECEFGEVR